MRESPWVVRHLRVTARAGMRRWRITMSGFAAPLGTVRRGWNQDSMTWKLDDSWSMAHWWKRRAPTGALKRQWVQVTTDADADDDDDDDG